MIASRWNLPSATNTITVSGSVPLPFEIDGGAEILGAVQPRTSPADKGFDWGIWTVNPRRSSSGLAYRMADANWIVPARTTFADWRLSSTVLIRRSTSMAMSTKT
ncbi:hypothetical protein PanWU01x14_088760 [Parasponia andersonii]|uniref:Uncharacterized protein n=1 Tax=Parasponia andersonii TaxID=3476 RepID=A0A2P5D834_PARAD|nr:hypothetical protein PanWU01x14_088760 [Parasponia andersonii]